MADIFEEATDNFYRRHPDPFDERAPHSIYPECNLGKLQKGKFLNPAEFIHVENMSPL